MSETPIYTQSQVERLLAAVSAAHLDNGSTRVAREESEEHMPINSKKDCYRLVDETVDEKHGAKLCTARLPAIGS